MNLLGGLGKAGTSIVGGVVTGAGKLVETVGEATESTGIIGSGVVGGVVEGTGKAIDTVGEAMKGLGDQIHVDITNSNENNSNENNSNNNILPNCVNFKNKRGEFLKPSGKYLKFSASSNPEDPEADFYVIPMDDGYVRLQHAGSLKYWIRDPDWIHCESIDTKKDNPNALFLPVKVGDNIVALRNKGNGHYCKGLTVDRKSNCLNAAVSNITEDACFQVTRVKSIQEHPFYSQGYIIEKYPVSN